MSETSLCDKGMSMVKSNIAKNYLDGLYDGVHGCSDAEMLCSSYSTILQIKHEHPDTADYVQSMYIDVKCFIDEYVSMVSHVNRDFGYDSADRDKIEKFIGFYPDAGQQVELFRHASIQLSSKGFSPEAAYFEDKYNTCMAISHIKKGRVKQKLVGLASLIVNNVWVCLALTAVVMMLHSVLLLPCSANGQALFEISYYGYSDNLYCNHLLNFLAYLLGTNETLFCKPLNAAGMLTNICFRLFYVLCVGGFLVENFKKEMT